MARKCSCGGDMKHTTVTKGDDTYDVYQCKSCGKVTEKRRPSKKHPLDW